MTKFNEVRTGGIYEDEDGASWVAIHRHVDFDDEARMARPERIHANAVFNDVDNWSTNTRLVEDWEYVDVNGLTDTGRTWGREDKPSGPSVQISSVKAALAALGIEADVVAVAQAIDNVLAEVAA